MTWSSFSFMLVTWLWDVMSFVSDPSNGRYELMMGPLWWVINLLLKEEKVWWILYYYYRMYLHHLPAFVHKLPVYDGLPWNASLGPSNFATPCLPPPPILLQDAFCSLFFTRASAALCTSLHWRLTHYELGKSAQYLWHSHIPNLLYRISFPCQFLLKVLLLLDMMQHALYFCLLLLSKIMCGHCTSFFSRPIHAESSTAGTQPSYHPS